MGTTKPRKTPTSISDLAAQRLLVDPPPASLRKAMSEGRVVPFIGAGISMGAKIDPRKRSRMPSYLELIEQLIDLADQDQIFKNPDRRKECRRLIEQGDLLRAADILDLEIPANSRYKFLRQLLNPLEPRPSLAHELLNILDFPIVLTSNYDRILESTFYPRPEVLTYEDSASIPLLLRERKPFVFKIHGDLTRPETIVLGWSKYRELQENEGYKALRHFIGSLLTEKTLLFLGCSLKGTEYSEYFLDYVETHRGIQPGPHYALVERGSLDPHRIDWWQRNLGVQILEYDKDPEHSHVWEFLSALKPRNTKKPRRGQGWETFFTLDERPRYLEFQRKREAAAGSCRYLTPKIMNALAPPAYIRRHCQEELAKYRDRVSDFAKFEAETTEAMLRRCRTTEEMLAAGTEMRIVFLAATLTEEFEKLGDLAAARFRHVLKLQKRFPDRLRLRAYPRTVDWEDFMKSSFALVFDRETPPDVDVAIFYAPQASSNKFITHIAQINTPYVTERIRHFEQRWSAALSEKETLEAIRRHAG